MHCVVADLSSCRASGGCCVLHLALVQPLHIVVDTQSLLEKPFLRNLAMPPPPPPFRPEFKNTYVDRLHALAGADLASLPNSTLLAIMELHILPPVPVLLTPWTTPFFAAAAPLPTWLGPHLTAGTSNVNNAG